MHPKVILPAARPKSSVNKVFLHSVTPESEGITGIKLMWAADYVLDSLYQQIFQTDFCIIAFLKISFSTIFEINNTLKKTLHSQISFVKTKNW